MSNIRKLMLIIAALLVCAVLASVVCVFTADGLKIPFSLLELPDSSVLCDIRLESNDGTAEEMAEVTFDGSFIHAKGLSKGRVYVYAEDEILLVLDTHENGIVYDEFLMLFNGWQAVVTIGSVFITAAFAAALLLTIKQMKRGLFSDMSPLMVTIALLLLFAAMMQVYALTGKTIVGMLSIFGNLTIMISLASLPVMLCLTLALCASNVLLIKKEGFALRNMLASMIGVSFCIRIFVSAFLGGFSGSAEEVRLRSTAYVSLSAMLSWSIMRLWGIIACAYAAVKRKVHGERDYVLILGCKIAKNGGLTALLRGRADAALDFRNRQLERTGKAPVLIACGGQGRDEVRSEAAAIKEYLLSKGVPEDGIILEDKSTSTIENMKNAQKLMRPGTSAAYATTNYHVFRSGVWAAEIGMLADGIGSKTRLYYWPNAFAREYLALIASRPVREFLATVLFAAIVALITYVAG